MFKSPLLMPLAQAIALVLVFSVSLGALEAKAGEMGPDVDTATALVASLESAGTEVSHAAVKIAASAVKLEKHLHQQVQGAYELASASLKAPHASRHVNHSPLWSKVSDSKLHLSWLSLDRISR